MLSDKDEILICRFWSGEYENYDINRLQSLITKNIKAKDFFENIYRISLALEYQIHETSFNFDSTYRNFKEKTDDV